jgi:hypothetical protein
VERVIIESPYAAKTEQGININEAYAELAMHDSLVNHDESPYASHLLYTRRFVLRDDIPEDRIKGIRAGFEWREVAEKTVFYTDLGMTDGMIEGLEDCKEKNKSYEIRRLPDYLWNKLIEYCHEANYVKVKRSAKDEKFNYWNILF